MRSTLVFRNATESDCSDLTILCDSATRCLTSHLWGESAAVGQSTFDVGRSTILTDAENHIYFKNWRIAEIDRRVAGAFSTYRLPQVDGVDNDIPSVLRPLAELKEVAQGTRYISTITVFPEFRGNRYATTMLEDAERMAKQSSDKRLMLLVGSFNISAIKVYMRFGLSEWDRREFVPFENSDREGKWVLMYKDVGLI